MKTKSIKKNYFFNLTYQILLIIIPLIVTPYISRVLLADGIGKFSFSCSIMTYFTIFATFGFDNYGQREIAKHQNNKEVQSKTFWEIFFSRLITVFISLSIHFVLLMVNAYKNYQSLMLILTLNILCVALDPAFFFQGNENFDKLVIRNIIVKIIGTAAIFIFVKSPSDLWKYTLIISSTTVLSILSLWPSLFKNLTRVNWKQIKPYTHLRGALKLFIPALAISLYTVLDKSLIGIITGSDVQNGYYEQTEKIVKLALTIITCLGAVMIARNSHEIAEGNHDNVKNNIYKAFNFVWLIGLPLMFGLMIIANNFIPWFLGNSFIPATPILIAFTPLILIIGTSNVIGLHFLIPYKKEKQYTIALLIGAGINLLLNMVLIYFYQSFGAALATIIAELSVTIAMLIFIRKDLNIKKIFNTIIKPMVSSIIMCIFIIPLSIFLSPGVVNTFIIICVGVAVYGISILILRESMVCNTLTAIKNKILKRNSK